MCQGFNDGYIEDVGWREEFGGRNLDYSESAQNKNEFAQISTPVETYL